MIDLSIVSHEYVSRCKDIKYSNCMSQISFFLVSVCINELISACLWFVLDRRVATNNYQTWSF